MTETERKYVIEYPDIEKLKEAEGTREFTITQTYLESDGKTERRIRKRECAKKTEYFYTEKTKISDISRKEEERSIDIDEYERLLKTKKQGTVSLEKRRFAIPYKGHTVEVDIYPFAAAWAIAEVELSGEDEKPELPPFISVIREVTGEKEYSNSYLAEARGQCQSQKDKTADTASQ